MSWAISIRRWPGRTRANALRVLNPDQAETRYRQLLDTAIQQQLFGHARVLAGDLINLNLNRGRLEEALTLADQKADYTRRAGYGPWSQPGDQVQRLQILYRQGHTEQVLDTGQELREQMATLHDPHAGNETVNPFNVRELLLNTMVLAARDITMVLAARDIGHWQQALDLNNDIAASERGPGATDAEQAATLFNAYGPLIRLGRIADARQLLYHCRQVFQDNGDALMLGKTLTAIAYVEDELGHPDRALDLEQDALPYKYLIGDPETIGISHFNLASYLDRAGGQPQQAGAHRLAAAVIGYQTGSGGLLTAGVLEALGQLLARDPAAVPATLAEVCRIVDQVPGGASSRAARPAPPALSRPANRAR
jgi:tetratricopeptide (TPR) repeat protein